MWFDDLVSDARYAIRSMVHTPNHSLVVVLTLMIGVGAATAILSVTNAILLRPLPYPNPDQLVRIVENAVPAPGGAPIRRRFMSRTEFIEWQKRTTTLSELGGVVTPPITVMIRPNETIRLSGALVSANVFEMLGAHALIGRALSRADDTPATTAVVLSHSAWHRYFGGNPNVLGQSVLLATQGPESGLLDGSPMEIVGVMPPDFAFPSSGMDFWTPLVVRRPDQERMFFATTIARMREGIELSAAAQEANQIGPAVRPLRPGAAAPAGPRFEVVRVADEITATVRPALRVLAIAVGVVLLIVCANIANLVIARNLARRGEIAVRMAVGASRARIFRQVLVECLVLAIPGALLGAVLAALGVAVVRNLATIDMPGIFQITFSSALLPRLDQVQVDLQLLAIALGLSLLSALVFGVWPAVHIARADSIGTISCGIERGRVSGAPAIRVRQMLAVGQITAAVVLLIGAALLIKSFVMLTRVNPGYNPAQVVLFQAVLPNSYPTHRKMAFVQSTLTELAKLPSVQSVGFSYMPPLLGFADTIGSFVPVGRDTEEIRAATDRPHARAVSSNYLQTMKVKLLEGRWLSESDDENAPPVLLVNRTLAAKVFGRDSAVGKYVYLDGRVNQPPQQIVGVVDDTKHGRVTLDLAPQMFVDYRQMLAMSITRKLPTAAQERLSLGFLSFVVRTGDDPHAVIPQVRAAVTRADSGAGIDSIAPLEDLVSEALAAPRFYATLLSVFAGVAALLAAIGVYGVLSFLVQHRTREFGLRLALGAAPSSVLWAVLRSAIALSLVGVAVGVIGAAATSRLLSGMLFGITALDRWTYVGVAATFAALAVFACYIPARRAIKVDPAVTLREG
ncbi:MAG: ABC transporter permease [Cyanobacteria bacterium]|nr:ABC transporter permease [Cyanobacteriota bacterium]